MLTGVGKWLACTADTAGHRHPTGCCCCSLAPVCLGDSVPWELSYCLSAIVAVSQADELSLSSAILECQTKVHESLLDNINTAGALDALAGDHFSQAYPRASCQPLALIHLWLFLVQSKIDASGYCLYHGQLK